uniref:Glycosyl transferase n=1 Tax=Tetraselmis sp. GSL018 TaxID=582737 RepID=A0A061S457_9CHLO|mmetsp:Transcript_35239/g.83567  ORF Transcript_35239/g.83567 Transcript_35239/m.83567 type:complete len:608 (+) Transcript_35239:581-2404(+)
MLLMNNSHIRSALRITRAVTAFVLLLIYLCSMRNLTFNYVFNVTMSSQSLVTVVNNSSYFDKIPLEASAISSKDVFGTTKVSALFTPFDIVAGGGEKYLLSVLSSFQSCGFSVHLIVNENNRCSSRKALGDVAKSLRVELNIANVELIILNSTFTFAHLPVNFYFVFFMLGNEKFPTHGGIGQLNLYMCQFPFDLDRKTPVDILKNLSGYHYVLVNSAYSLSYYAKYALPGIERSMLQYQKAPQVRILHPAAYSQPTSRKHSFKDKRNIVIIGRFFDGRQNKGHFEALKVFKMLQKCHKGKAELHMVGSVMKGHDFYVKGLQLAVNKLELNTSVFLHLGASVKEMEFVLSKTLILWHLTGVEHKLRFDPASQEHFGIAIVEGMGYGVIPVALKSGGVGDIVDDNVTGYFVDSLEEMAECSCYVLNRSLTNNIAMINAAERKAKHFSLTRFISNLKGIISDSVWFSNANAVVKNTWTEVTNMKFHLTTETTRYVLVFDFNLDVRLEYGVKKILLQLGKDWGLIIVHNEANDGFVRRQLQSVHNTIFERATSQFNHNINQLVLQIFQKFCVTNSLIFQDVNDLLLDRKKVTNNAGNCNRNKNYTASFQY